MRRRWLAKLMLFAVLEVGALAGVPIRPDQIEELARLMNQTVATTVKRREADGDDPR